MSYPLHIAFVWHMHQPYYRNLLTDDCFMPWVRLHGTKDYLDMVKILEAFPSLHQTFNLVPSLIDQLEAYLPPANRSDRFLQLSEKPAASLTDEEKRFLLGQFFMANWERMVKPVPRYHDLLAKRGNPLNEQGWAEAIKRFKPQDYLDLQVWFNLAWIDPWLRSRDQALAALAEKGSHFTEAEKQQVLEKHRAILRQIIPAYRQAQARGQIELTTSPYYHPIMPLLCDLRSAQMAVPNLSLPDAAFRHPEDARWHLEQGLDRHEQAFGRRPQGVWPPEGSVSEDLIRLAIEARVRWLATDEEILWRTLKSARSPAALYRPHLVRRKGGDLAMVFRDRELSDLIGFTYSQWKPAQAVSDFLKRLERIAQSCHADRTPSLVSIILDGENAWEFYAQDGHEFLSSLYQALAHEHRFRLVTVSEFLDQFPLGQDPSLPELFAGSWIDGNFATWIGHAEKNTAWVRLAEAREQLEAAAHPPEQAWRNFYVAEGSDWMWWYGDTHSSAHDEEFDALFRAHVANVYRGLGQEPPPQLALPIKSRLIRLTREPTATMTPVIDGRETSYYEWLYAGGIDLRKSYAAMHRSQQLLQRVSYGFDQAAYYFRLDLEEVGLKQHPAWRIDLEFLDRHTCVTVQAEPSGGVTASLSRKDQAPAALACAYQRILELAVPMALLPVAPGETCQLRLTLFDRAQPLERYPDHGAFHVVVPPSDFALRIWSV